MKKAILLGHATRVINQAPSFAAAAEYVVVWVQNPDGSARPLLFTERDLDRAAHRASRNPEDVPALRRPGFWQRLLGRK